MVPRGGSERFDIWDRDGSGTGKQGWWRMDCRSEVWKRNHGNANTRIDKDGILGMRDYGDEHWGWDDIVEINPTALDLLAITIMIAAPIIEYIDEAGERYAN
jgi:hypothetical protein